MIAEVTHEGVAYTIDFTPILTPGEKFAVLLDTTHEASILIAAMRRAYPDKCDWNPNLPPWDVGYVKYEDGVVYFPDVNNAEDCTIQWCSQSYALGYNYTVVPFSDLLAKDDPLDEGDQNISELFGMLEVGA